MDLRRHEDAWRRRDLGECFFTRPGSALDLLTRFRALWGKTRRSEIVTDLFAPTFLTLPVSCLFEEQSKMSRAGLIIMVASAVLVGASCCALRLKYRGKTVALPMRLFYIEERKRLDHLIRWSRWPADMICLPVAIGFGLYLAGRHPSTWRETFSLAAALCLFPLAYLTARKKVAELHALRERVDRHLRELERDCNREPDGGDPRDSQANGP